MSFLKRSLPIVLIFLAAVSCAKKDAGSAAGAAPHGSVIMRDGTTYTGAVTSTSPTQVTVAADDNSTHILAMKDVRSINYDDSSAAQPPAQPASTAPAAPPPTSAPPSTPAAQAPPPPPEPAHENHYHPPENVIRTKTYDLPVGTQIAVRAEETIDSAKAAEGQTYAAEVARDVHDANGEVVIPRGANAVIVIRSASKGGRFRGTSDLVLDLASVAVEGRQYRLSTADIAERGKSGMGVNKRTGEFTGGGAVIGAVIGAIAGGGKGAAIGAGSGAGAGALTQAITKGGSIKVPAETVLTFQLDQPLHVSAAR
jgi:hypothetical protein